MAQKPKQPNRSVSTRQDLGSIEAISYNDAAGARKIIVIEPVIKRTVAIGEIIGGGKYVKITGTSYTLDLLGKVYSAAVTYQKGDIVTTSGSVYTSNQDMVTGTFDATKWQKQAPKQIASIPIAAGSVVNTGRWHNTVTVAGFLVDDESEIKFARIRD